MDPRPCLVKPQLHALRPSGGPPPTESLCETRSRGLEPFLRKSLKTRLLDPPRHASSWEDSIDTLAGKAQGVERKSGNW